MNIKIIFWEKVRKFRLESWLSQEELWFKAKLHRTYIWNIERWEKNLTLENIEKLAIALDINIKDFFDDWK